jgi:hypothetical protein
MNNTYKNLCKLNLFINKIKNYEPNIVNIIYNLTKKYIKINDYYIIEKKIRGENKKQIVKIDDYEVIKDMNGLTNYIYSYDYGVYGFHEGFCLYHEIRFLTDEERDKNKNGRFWKLPQEFYQSSPT